MVCGQVKFFEEETPAASLETVSCGGIRAFLGGGGAERCDVAVHDDQVTIFFQWVKISSHGEKLFYWTVIFS